MPRTLVLNAIAESPRLVPLRHSIIHAVIENTADPLSGTVALVSLGALTVSRAAATARKT